MRLAHVREHHAPAGAPWRLAAALGDDRWLDLEPARRRAIVARPELEHDAGLFRQPITHARRWPPARPPGRGIWRAAGAVRVSGRGRPGGPRCRQPGVRAARARAALAARRLRLRTARRDDVAPPGRRDPRGLVSTRRSSTSRTSPSCAGPTTRSGRRRDREELDFEIEIAALIDTPARDLQPDRAEDAIGGYTIFNDWSARDLQRDETVLRLGPAKGKDFASSIGPWLVTPDELEDARAGHGFDLAMTVTVNGVETSRGRWSDIVHGFAELAARASADVDAAARGAARIRDGRHRMPARGPRPDARSVPAARRRGRAERRPPRVAPYPGGRATRPEVPARCDDAVVPRRQAVRVEPMEPADWPAVHRIYADGIATGDATLEREAPDWDHFDRSHRRDCRLVARARARGSRRSAGSP